MTSSKDEEKKDKATALEDVAEETGELIGKSVKKTWNVMKSFGKGFADTIDKKEKNTPYSVCAHCGVSIPTSSNFCAKCGKKV